MLRLLVESLPLLLNAAMVMAYMRIDMVMLGAMAPPSELGIYAAAVRLCEAWYFIPITIIHATTASLLRAKAHGQALYQRRLRQLLQGLVLFVYAVSVGATLVADPLIRLLFRDAFAGAAPVLSLYIWATLFIVLSTGSSAYLVNEGLRWLLPIRAAAGAVLNIALNLLLIPAYGAIGAAIATLISYAVMGWLVHLAYDRVSRELFVFQTRALACLDTPLLWSMISSLHGPAPARTEEDTAGREKG